MHWNVALRLLISCSALLTAMPISSTNWAHWSALMTLSKYSRIKLEKADKALLSPCANLLYATVLLAKLKASMSIDLLSAICKQWYACEQSNLQNSFLPAMPWVLGCICEGTHGVIVIYIIVGNKVIDFSQIDKQSQFAVRFLLGKNWACVFGEWVCFNYP